MSLDALRRVKLKHWFSLQLNEAIRRKLMFPQKPSHMRLGRLRKFVTNPEVYLVL